ncbi:MAG: hypothetical protein KGL37_05425 [Acidobacteriota bacterium]|nr:hypothetical protein [Acidobacteriota bacterium]
MRRGLSIFLVLFFGLGPLTATLPASDDASLPPCCRRHGAHHCAMAMRMAAMMVQAAYGSVPIVSAPARCPFYPHHPAAWTTPFHALIASPTCLSGLLAQAHVPVAEPAGRSLYRIRVCAGRGPPTPALG